MPRQRLIHFRQQLSKSCSLADEDLHGYAIMRRVEEQANGRLRLGPGTLYSCVQVLLEEGFIDEVEDRGGKPAGHERRSEADRLAGLLRLAFGKEILRGDYV